MLPVDAVGREWMPPGAAARPQKSLSSVYLGGRLLLLGGVGIATITYHLLDNSYMFGSPSLDI